MEKRVAFQTSTEMTALEIPAFLLKGEHLDIEKILLALWERRRLTEEEPIGVLVTPILATDQEA